MVLDAAGEPRAAHPAPQGRLLGAARRPLRARARRLAGAALREAPEESGVAGLRLVGDGPVELDRHQLSSAFGTCGQHLDVRYAALAPVGAEPVISDESHDLAWFPLDATAAGAVEDMGRLAGRALAALLCRC